jgi:polar amino acid transport system substrate-binding protein
VKGSPAAQATSLADLKPFKIGAQTGTTSLTAIRDQIQPNSDAVVFKNTNDAKTALANGQVDAIVADLPTAFYLVAVEIDHGTIVGQFPSTGEPEQFGMLFAKGNPLVGCVNQALATIKENGTLAAIEKKWLSDTVNVPVLK